jgi:uncharacterized membrane protein
MRKYTGYAYVKKLERHLRKLPYEERLDAVTYYSEYLAEAGPEREREVIERLGPPQRVAAEIRADAALRELNSKAWLAERAKEAKKARKERRRAEAGGAYEATQATQGDGSFVSHANDESHDKMSYRRYDGVGTNEHTDDAQESADASTGEGTPYGPNMSESFSAAGLGAMSMLSMPVARPLAVLACVSGIFGLVIGVIVVAALYCAAGALAICGVISFGVSFILLPQDPMVTLFLAGTGVALVGAGLVIGILNYLLGRAIFKGIANLSGRIRHRRVKVRKEIFNYNYAYTDGNPYVAGSRDAHPQGADSQDAHPQDAGSQDAHPQDAGPQDAHPQGAHPQGVGSQDAPPYGADLREETPGSDNPQGEEQE